MQRVGTGKYSELGRSYEQKIYRKPLVTLRMKSTHELQTSTPRLKCLQQIFTVIKIVLGNGIKLLQYLIRQQEQHPKQKRTDLRTILLS